MLNKKNLPDGSPTISEWPIRIWNIEEIPRQYASAVHIWLTTPFSEYDFVYAPKRKTNDETFEYLFGYGNGKIIYLRRDSQGAVSHPIEINRQQITEVETERELLNAKIILHYRERDTSKTLELSYVPSVYYLYDPFLNWVLGLDKEFMPELAEQGHPRPEKLYHESLAMFNYSLNAYRLGSGFEKYQYEFRQHRCKWMPWKKTIEEWLKVPMERGMFKLYSYGYFTQCVYCIK